MAVPISRFFELLVELGFVNAAEAEAIRQSVPPAQWEADCTVLARKLVQQRLLTDYQAAQLSNGQIQEIVFGDYVVLDQIGKGGMAAVYKARRRDSDQIVAVKVLSPDVAESEESSYRFDREVQAAAKLSHQNIVAAYDAFHVGGMHYLVMEYVEGANLSQYVKKHGPLPVEDALAFVHQTASGLKHAHDKRIVHRDVKPDNLLVTPTGVVKILDMGLVRFDNAPPVDKRPDSVDRLTQMGVMLGTADYMSPEQSVDARGADYRSDVYSLGCTLYFLLTGKGPFSRDTTMATLMAHQTEPIPKIGAVRNDVPPDVQALWEKMAAKDPKDRLQNMDAVLDAIERIVPTLHEPTPAPGSVAAGGAAAASRGSSIRRFGLVLGILFGAGLGVLGALYPNAVTAPYLASLQLQHIDPLLPFAGIGALVGALLGVIVGEIASSGAKS